MSDWTPSPTGRSDWRLRLLVGSILRYYPAMPLKLAFSILLKRRQIPMWSGEIEILNHESDDLIFIRIGDFRYCVPSALVTNERTLRMEYAAVWDLSTMNDHRYQFGRCLIRPGDVVVDAGACEGFFTRFALEKGASKVIAVEPMQQMYKCLLITFEDEIRKGMVEIRQLCIGDKKGVVPMEGDPKHPEAFRRADEASSGQDCEIVPMDTLDNVIERGCDFLKMDIEGSEVLALKSSVSLRTFQKMRMAITTYHRETDGAAIKKIVAAHFPRHVVQLKGMSWPGGKKPRPKMLYAWPS